VLPLLRTSELLLASPSVPEFHRIGACDQAFADCHRRFGFTPTPEHVDALSLVNAASDDSFPVIQLTSAGGRVLLGDDARRKKPA